jgi:hypothetical protein
MIKMSREKYTIKTLLLKEGTPLQTPEGNGVGLESKGVVGLKKEHNKYTKI